ncbi:uncharacterized protein HfgLR_03055 [Haloferax gibbonsii]|uniref:Uncharacterized protein n=1 Tax=Haloferax gibbonsii TaxID=35746 RepID=A0A871BCM4_HALGI|nr:uncharacterized protein HfgLR_03055 [Haloferax gibbonsii]
MRGLTTSARRANDYDPTTHQTVCIDIDPPRSRPRPRD